MKRFKICGYIAGRPVRYYKRKGTWLLCDPREGVWMQGTPTEMAARMGSRYIQII